MDDMTINGLQLAIKALADRIKDNQYMVGCRKAELYGLEQDEAGHGYDEYCRFRMNELDTLIARNDRQIKECEKALEFLNATIEKG